MASFQDASTGVNVLDTIPEDQPSNEWMPRNISLQRWWDVMTLRTPRSESSQAGSSSTGGGNGVSIPSDEAEIQERTLSEGGSNVVDAAGQSTGATTAVSSRHRPCSRTSAYLGLIALVAALVTGAGVGIFFIVDSTKGDEVMAPSSDVLSPASTTTPPPAYSFDDRPPQTEEDKEEIEVVLQSISGDALLDSNSPQSMAAAWLLDEDRAQMSVKVDGEERVKQRYALSVVYFSLDGPKDGFLSPSDECGWTGVTCNDAGLDVGLNLTGLGLQGSIPPEIGELSLLEQLVMSDNVITGNIPFRLWGLPFLYIIDLSENRLTGTVSSFLWDLPFLEYAYLNSNNITGTLPDLPDTVPPLKHIWLHENSLAGRIPSTLSNLVDLETLVLYNNNFNSMLELQWSEMTKLFYVDVSWNQLSGHFPDGLYAATSLKFLYLNNNTMTGLLDENLGQIRQLQELWLQSNSFTGEIPEQWSEMESISTLLLYDNALNGTVPEAICNLTTTTGNLTVFETDCKGGNSTVFVNCTCCTTCH